MAVERFRSLGLARARLQQRIRRAQDLRPVLMRVAPKIEEMARLAIEQSRSPSGQQFAPLAPSTLAARKPGEGVTPLNKTGAGKASIRCFVSSRNELRMLFAHYLKFHMTAGPHRPMRNAFPFEIGIDGQPHPISKIDQLIRAELRAYIQDGKAAVDVPLAAE